MPSIAQKLKENPKLLANNRATVTQLGMAPVVKGAKDPITQSEMAKYWRLRNRLQVIETEMKKMDESILERLENKAKVESGKFIAFIQETAGKRCPHYKEELQARIGEDGIKALIAATEPGKPSRKVKIVERVPENKS